MQPAPKPEAPWDARQPETAQPEPQRDAVAQAYNTRFCDVCQRKYPPFGFGPPLTRPGQTIWACQPHQEDVYGALSGGNSLSGGTQAQPISHPQRP